ncbi:MAG: hypothetical protein R6V54_05555, partial [Desulfobacteraceae bacterium]
TCPTPLQVGQVSGLVSGQKRGTGGLSILKHSGQYDKIYDRWFGVYEESGSELKKTARHFFIIVLVLMVIIALVFLWNFSLRKAVDGEIGETERLQQRPGHGKLL